MVISFCVVFCSSKKNTLITLQGMLASCLKNNWPLESYRDFHHPLQIAIRKEIALAASLDHEKDFEKWGVDGCGVPTYSLPLKSMALMYAKIKSEPEMRLVKAMRNFPEYIGGKQR